MHFHFLINFSAMIWLSSMLRTEFHLLYFNLALWYLPHLEIARLAKLHCSMDDLPEALLVEIIKRLTSPSDLKSLSLVSKRLYAVEGELRNSMYFGCGIYPTMALIRLCFRYPNLCKVKFHAMSLDDHGLQVFSSCCPSLADLTLSFARMFMT